MRRQLLIRFTAVTAIAAAVLLLVSNLMHPPQHDVPSILESQWALIHWMGAAGFGMLLFFCVCIYALQERHVGMLGVAGVVLAVWGCLLLFGDMFFAAYIQPPITREAPDVMQLLQSGDGPLFEGGRAVVVPLRNLCFGFGVAVLAIAIGVYGTLPKWAASAFGVGAMLTAYGPLAGRIFGTIGILVMGIGAVGMAITLLKGDDGLDGESWLDAPQAPAGDGPAPGERPTR